MKINYQYTLAHFDPDHSIGTKLDLDIGNAIELFNNFNWDLEFEKVAERNKNNKSSTIPSISFTIPEKRKLQISATNDLGFEVYFERDKQFSHIYISNSVLDRPEGVSVDYLIAAFFNDSIEEILELHQIPANDLESVDLKISYTQTKLNKNLFLIAGPSLAIALFFAATAEPAFGIPFLLIVLIGGYLLLLPKLRINRSYWNNDVDQTIHYDPASQMLTIKKGGLLFAFPKNEIEDCKFITSPRRTYEDYNYMRFRWKDQHFAVTFLTTDPEAFILTLRVNFETIEMGYPKLYTGQLTDVEKQKKEEKYKEFLEIYEAWDNEKLQDVISNTDYYADYAVRAAKEILEERGIKPTRDI